MNRRSPLNEKACIKIRISDFCICLQKCEQKTFSPVASEINAKKHKHRKTIWLMDITMVVMRWFPLKPKLPTANHPAKYSNFCAMHFDCIHLSFVISPFFIFWFLIVVSVDFYGSCVCTPNSIEMHTSFFCIYWCLENSKSASYIHISYSRRFWEFPHNGLCFKSIRIHSFGENNYNTNGILRNIWDFYVHEIQTSRTKNGKDKNW